MTHPVNDYLKSFAEIFERAAPEGIFRDHRCAYCDDGKKPCRQGSPNRCDNPRARND